VTSRKAVLVLDPYGEATLSPVVFKFCLAGDSKYNGFWLYWAGLRPIARGRLSLGLFTAVTRTSFFCIYV
jgi:hypothetical protein